MAKVVTQQDAALWVQPKDGQTKYYVPNFKIEGLKTAEGQESRINMPNKTSRRSYDEAGRTTSAPDIAGFDLTIRELQGGIPRWVKDLKRGANLYIAYGTCGQRDSFLEGWENGHIKVISNARRSGADFGGLNDFDADKPREVKLSCQSSDPYHIGAISFGEQAASLITTEVKGVAFSTKYSDGDCGASNDGTQWAYILCAAAVGSKPYLIYTTNGGGSWTNLSLATAANNDVVAGIAANDKYVVVLNETSNAILVSALNDAGVPAAATQVSTGFVATKTPTDVKWVTGNKFLISGKGGYIYATKNNPLDGVDVLSAANAVTSDLNRVSISLDRAVWGVGGADGVVLYSTNEGTTWVAPSNSPFGAGTNVTALSIVDKYRIWVGSSAGNVYKTLNGGASAWDSFGFSGSGTGSIPEILHITPQVFYIAHTSAAPLAALWSCYDGGSEIDNNTPRLVGLPAAVQKFSRLAYPPSADVNVQVNTLLLGGLNAGGTDGYAALGSGTYVW